MYGLDDVYYGKDRDLYVALWNMPYNKNVLRFLHELVSSQIYYWGYNAFPSHVLNMLIHLSLYVVIVGITDYYLFIGFTENNLLLNGCLK